MIKFIKDVCKKDRLLVPLITMLSFLLVGIFYYTQASVPAMEEYIQDNIYSEEEVKIAYDKENSQWDTNYAHFTVKTSEGIDEVNLEREPVSDDYIYEVERFK